MAISRNSNRAKIVILALSSALTLTAGTAIGRDKPPQALSDAIAAEVKHQSTLQGILFLGPVENVSSDSRRLQVLGHKLRKRSPEPTLLPAQYVAVFGEISSSGSIRVSRIQVLDEVYVPGISPVIAAGTLLSSGNGTQFGSVGRAQINALAFEEFGEWSRAHSRKLSLVIGTQPIAGAAIDASAIAAFERDTEVALDISRTQDRGIDGSGVSVSVRGIDGSGMTSLGRGIDGSGAATKGIDGSGAATRGIDGSGAATKGIDGSGAATKGIDGSGATTKGIDGSGAATKGIDGSGAATRGIDGSGAATKGIDGSGAATKGIDGSGAATKGIDGSGAATKGIDGSGAATRGIDGSGAATRGIDGSGAATRGIDGSGAATKGIDGSGAATKGIDGSGSHTELEVAKPPGGI